MIRQVILLVFFHLLFIGLLCSQNQGEVKKINLIHSDIAKIANSANNKANRLLGNVKAEHEGSFLWCDSAYLYNNNSMDAFGNVHIQVNDTLDLFGDRVFYNGNTKVAEVHDNVRLVDKKATLYTDFLVYDRQSNIGEYYVWGRIEDSSNVLTSKKGYYYNLLQTVFFKDSVVVVNPDYVMKSDTLKYNTKTETVVFLGPTTIEGDSSFLYAERGSHQSQTRKTILYKNAFVQNKSNTLKGDSIYYTKEDELAKAFGHVVMTDTAKDVKITGGFAYYHKLDLLAYVIDSALAVFEGEEDTLYLHADTLMMHMDSAEKPRLILAYHYMKFFGKDMQGMADSLAYDMNDSIMRMFGKPILWFDENQLSAERIDLISKEGKMDSAAFQQNVFLVNQDTVDPAFYNQVSSKNMYAWFSENELHKILFKDKAESIFFLWEEDGKPIGMNRLSATDMLVFLHNQEVETVTYIQKPTALLTPFQDINPSSTKLPNFIWHMDWRPLKPEDIFIKSSSE